jgi:RNA polymerase sigma-70 factor (ECF subfamily)
MTDTAPELSPTPAEQVQMLFVRHEGAIRAFVRALQPSLMDADDVLQETFLTVSRKASSFEPGTNFIAWACGIARLKVLESYRQQKRANGLSEAALIALAEQAPAPEITALREEALSRCIEKLAPKSRDLLWRRYSNRQDSEEMAAALGMTSTAVRVALSKARAFLRDCVSTSLNNVS